MFERLRFEMEQSAAKTPELAHRIEKAGMIVAVKGIQAIDDKPGWFFVPSLGDESGKGYEVGPTSCTCQDHKRGAPQGWCKHRIAVVLAKRLERYAAKQPSVEVLNTQLAEALGCKRDVETRLSSLHIALEGACEKNEMLLEQVTKLEDELKRAQAKADKFDKVVSSLKLFVNVALE